MGPGDDELHRRLAQTRRLVSAALDAVTMERLTAMVAELEKQIAAAEVPDAGLVPS